MDLLTAAPLTLPVFEDAVIAMREWTGSKQYAEVLMSPADFAAFMKSQADYKVIESSRCWRAVARSLGWRKVDIRAHRRTRTRGNGHHWRWQEAADQRELAEEDAL